MSTTTIPTQPPDVATPAETREDLIAKSGAGYTLVRHVFCQLQDEDGTSVPGVLGQMVTGRKRRALQLYLLLLTVWPWLSAQERPLPAAVWARALTTDKGRLWSTTNVSDTWRDLEDLGLVNRRRLARGVVVTPRREDTRAAYARPAGTKKDRTETYFTLPPDFWTDCWFEELSLPALAMLLIVAARTSKDDEAWLTNKDAAQWYGLSPRSVEGGLKELVDVGLVTERIEWIKAPLSAIGATKRHYYALNGSFSTDSRRAMQSKARAERASRLGTAKTTKKGGVKARKKSNKVVHRKKAKGTS